MKLIKRFSALRKGLGTAALVSALFVFGSCQNMTTPPAATMVATASKTLYAPTFPEQTDANGNSIDGLLYSKRYYTVSQGQKRKISLSWTPVEIAKYYQVFAAKNINDTFVKIGETKNPNFEDSVGSGCTFYYKVRAINSKGEMSDFSSIVHGTSLATPAINNIVITDTSATVFWYMGNVGIDSYVMDLVYEIHAFKGSEEKIATIKAWDETNQNIVESYTFEKLNGNSDYEFRVDAYIASDQGKTESSAKVSKKTLAQYTPVSPDFTATQGESINNVTLHITLPPKVQVSTRKKSTTNPNPNQYEIIDYPLSFEIQRKKTTETEWKTIASPIYFNGKSTSEKPTDADYANYKEGTIVDYEDTVIHNSSMSVARGIKYDYRIISYIDLNYSDVNTYEYDTMLPSKADIANTAVGWVAEPPSFRVSKFAKKLDSTETNVLTVTLLGFDASWTDLGKAPEYKFAVQEKRSRGTSTYLNWLTDANGNRLLESLEKVTQLTKTYDLSEDVEGTYEYILYVIPIKYTDIDLGSQYPLTTVRSSKIIPVDKNATTPITDLEAAGGWKDHTKLTWTVQDNVNYWIDWSKYNSESPGAAPIATGTLEPKDLGVKGPTGSYSYTGEYLHYVDGGYLYKYRMRANSTSQADLVEAKTLGTPAITFEANSYTNITVSWPQVMAAEEYEIVLGESGSFGNKLTLSIGKEPDDDGEIYKCVVDGSNIKLTIKKPYGYKDATLSGKAAKLKVTAMSELDASTNHVKDTTSAAKDVWTIGPAAVNLKATKENVSLAADSITISWTKLEGAKKYAVYRERPAMTTDTDSNDVKVKTDPSMDVFIVDATGSGSNDNIECSLSSDGKTFTLVDKYKKITDPSASKNQEYLALGLPFTYSIVPVLQEEHIKDGDELLQKAQNWKNPESNETYTGFDSTQKVGFTTGYGLALEATKAESSTDVVLTWEMPQSAIDYSTVKPHIFYRKKSGANWDSTWTSIGALVSDKLVVKDGQAKYTLMPEALAATKEDQELSYQELQYAVSYATTLGSSEEKDVSYVEYLDGKYNLKVTPRKEEIKSVGYAFTLPPIEFAPINTSNEQYYEEFDWFRYAHNNNRALGKDIAKYELTVKNLNCSADDWEIITYNAKGDETAKTNRAWYDINELKTSTVPNTANSTSLTVKLTPGTIDQTNNTGTHNGLLKVQRDYKHYYKLTATRDNGMETSREVTLYRKITNDEFAKCVTLIMADSLLKKGGDNEAPPKMNGASGSFTTEYTYNAGIWYEFYYKYDDYKAKFAKLPGQDSTLTSSFILDSERSPNGAAIDNKILGWGNNKITVTHDNGLNSYQGELTLSCGINDAGWFNYSAHWNLSLSYKNKDVSSANSRTANNETNFKAWFPFPLATKLTSSVIDENNSAYSSYPTMQGTWWDKKQKETQ